MRTNTNTGKTGAHHESGACADEVAVRLATRQHGVVARGQLLAAGVMANGVDRLVKRRRLRPLHRGVYLLGSLQGPLEPEHARAMAAVLACGADAVLSHRSAAHLWGILSPGVAPRGRRSGGATGAPGSRTGGGGTDTRGTRAARRVAGAHSIDVTIPRSARRERAGIHIHRPRDLFPDDVTSLNGIPVTTAARTLRDLSTVLTVRGLNQAAARAEREGLLDAIGLPDLVDYHAGRTGAPVLRRALLGEAGLVLTRSEAEERILNLVDEAGLPRPQANVVVAGYEVDCFWPEAKLIVEVDGFAYHSSRGSFENDRRRDGDLEARGYRVVRVTWRQIVQERTATAARIAGVLGSAIGSSTR